jgi:hypothetical protein
MACALLNGLQRCLSNIILKPPLQEGNGAVHASPQKPVLDTSDLLRTNLPPGEPATLWKNYIQLTEAEAAFRALKSELSIRPIFHQLERRAKAHILVAFLGYALWVTLKHLLMRKDSALSPSKALAALGTLVSADIVLPTTDGREIRLRRVTTPSAERKQLLDQLGITIPERLCFDQECSADSKIA